MSLFKSVGRFVLCLGVVLALYQEPLFFVEEGGELCVAQCDQDYAGVLTVPSSIGEIPVTKINANAMNNVTGITQVVLPESIEQIGDSAFEGCTQLSSINLPDGLERLGWYAFYKCESLLNVTVPDSILFFGESVFRDCSNLQQVTLPSSLTQIRNYTFYGCHALVSLTIPETVSLIGDFAFYECNSLSTLSLPIGLDYIGASAFRNSDGLVSMTLPAGVSTVPASAFFGCNVLSAIEMDVPVDANNAKVGTYFSTVDGVLFDQAVEELIFFPSNHPSSTYLVPDSVISIGSSAFYGANSITSVTLSSSLTAINAYAFRYCALLSSIAVPAGVTTISDLAFADCPSLTAVNVDAGNLYYSSVDGVLFDADGSQLIYYPLARTATSYAIPAAVNFISDTAFTGSLYLASFTVESGNTQYSAADGVLYNVDGTILLHYPKAKTDTVFTVASSVVHIGEYAFAGNRLVEEVVLPRSIQSLGIRSFAGCIGLQTMSFPVSITSIPALAFSGCTNLQTVEFSTQLNSIGSYAFASCSSLTEVYFPGNLVSLEYAAFTGCSSLDAYYFDGSIPTGANLLGVSDPNSSAAVYAYATAGFDSSYYRMPVQIIDPPVITIADAQLESAIRSAIGIPTGDLTTEDMKLLTRLNLGGVPVAALSGLEYAINLRLLNIRGTSITDYTAADEVLDQLYLYCLYRDFPRGDGADINTQLSVVLTGTDGTPIYVTLDTTGLESINVTDGTFDLEDPENITIIQEIGNNGITVDTGTENLAPAAGCDDLIGIDYDGDGFATVELDGRGSGDLDGTIVSWVWSWQGGSVNGALVEVDFPLGVTAVTLTVTDDDGATHSVSCDAEVKARASSFAEALHCNRLRRRATSDSDRAPNADPHRRGLKNGVAYALGLPLVGRLNADHRARLPKTRRRKAGDNFSRFNCKIPKNLPADVAVSVKILAYNNGETPVWVEMARRGANGGWTGDLAPQTSDYDADTDEVEFTSPNSYSQKHRCFWRLDVDISE